MKAITLTMENFKCFMHETVVLDSFTLLDGKSGAGKTSILKALLFVFTGKGKQCIRFGCKSCRVTASFTHNNQSFFLQRTIRPNRFLLNVNSIQYEDNPAQIKLNEIFSVDDLVSIGYVSQNVISFTNKSPHEKFKLIQSLIFDVERLSIIKDRLKQLRLTRQRTYDILQGKYKAFDYIKVKESKCPVESIEELEAFVTQIQMKIQTCEEKNYIREFTLNKLTQLSTRPLNIVQMEFNQLNKSLPFLTAWYNENCPSIDLVLAVPDLLLLKQRTEWITELKSCQEKLENSGIESECPYCKNTVVIRFGHLFKKTGPVTQQEPVNIYQRTITLTNLLSSSSTPVTIFSVTDLTPCILSLYEKHPGFEIPADFLSTSLYSLNQQHAKLKQELLECHERLQLESSPIPEFTDLSEEYATLVITKEKLSDAINSKNKKIHQLQQGAKIAAELMADLISQSVALECLITEAETKVLEDSLQTIGAFLNHLMQLITFGKIEVQLVLDAKKVHLVIINEGQTTDHTTLSGGELARLNIALSVVFATAKELPILMIDEATSSLDEETAQYVLGLIRQYYQGMILCVAHQAVKGGFPIVIQVENLRENRKSKL